MEVVTEYPPLTGPPAPATLPGLAPAFSFQKEELLLLPAPEVVELVISGILWSPSGDQDGESLKNRLRHDAASEA